MGMTGRQDLLIIDFRRIHNLIKACGCGRSASALNIVRVLRTFVAPPAAIVSGQPVRNQTLSFGESEK